jgi:hypothetical protein
METRVNLNKKKYKYIKLKKLLFKKKMKRENGWLPICKLGQFDTKMKNL